MTLGNIAIGIIIVAVTALINLSDKEYENDRKSFESEE